MDWKLCTHGANDGLSYKSANGIWAQTLKLVVQLLRKSRNVILVALIIELATISIAVRYS
jgi:hypothetical protein